MDSFSQFAMTIIVTRVIRNPIPTITLALVAVGLVTAAAAGEVPASLLFGMKRRTPACRATPRASSAKRSSRARDPLRPRTERQPDAGPRARALRKPGDDRDGSRQPACAAGKPTPGDRRRHRAADRADPRQCAAGQRFGRAHRAPRRHGARSRRARAAARSGSAPRAGKGLPLSPLTRADFDAENPEYWSPYWHVTR